jgi:hypothetical protein
MVRAVSWGCEVYAGIETKDLTISCGRLTCVGRLFYLLYIRLEPIHNLTTCLILDLRSSCCQMFVRNSST